MRTCDAASSAADRDRHHGCHVRARPVCRHADAGSRYERRCVACVPLLSVAHAGFLAKANAGNLSLLRQHNAELLSGSLPRDLCVTCWVRYAAGIPALAALRH